MSLRGIADQVSGYPRDNKAERRVRACLANMLTCLQLDQIKRDTLAKRLRVLIESYEGSARKDLPGLQAALEIAMSRFGEEDHYDRPEPLCDQVEERAVTIQSDGNGYCGELWLGRPAPAKVISEQFVLTGCRGWVGPPKKPVWLTPYSGELRMLCEEAKGMISARRRTEIVKRTVEMMGLCHFFSGEGVLAFVTSRPIRELKFTDPNASEERLPVGSTILEARTHPRFRPWPTKPGADAYGRTYDLDDQYRKSANPVAHYGVPEATRTRMDMSDFAECIYLGQVGAWRHGDDDGAYLNSIGASKDALELLRDLDSIGIL